VIVDSQATLRYQQVFAASQFQAVPPGGAYLTRLYFRTDCGHAGGSCVNSNIQVNISTTVKDPDQLSAAFAENVGLDDTVVFHGPFTAGTAAGGCPPAFFENSLGLDRPFFYNPLQGNLLLDVRSYPGHTLSIPLPPQAEPAHDATDVAGDSVSRVYALSVTASVAEHIETTGIITEFEFHPVPALTNTLTTNGLVLSWAARPATFELQWSHEVGSQAKWLLYTNSIGGGFLFKTAVIPFPDLRESRFFRLAWESGRPLPQKD
jgi:hypothetical protein